MPAFAGPLGLSLRVAAIATLCLAFAAPARLVRPLGHTPHLQPRLEAPRIWIDPQDAFALERPEGERWSFRAGAQGPDGVTLPLLAVSPESGAEVIVQAAERVSSMRGLAQALADKLSDEEGLHTGDIEKVGARGGEAYGFRFTVASAARGRVAVVRAGAHVALVIASWPVDAPQSVEEDVASMIESLGPAPAEGSVF